jgi:Ribosome recycling factor
VNSPANASVQCVSAHAVAPLHLCAAKKAIKGGKAAAPKKGATQAADDSDDEADEHEADSDDSGNESDEPVYNTVDDLVPLPQLKERLNRVLEGLKKDLAVLRGGRVDPGMFDHLTVHSYGQEGPLSSVAQVSVKGPQLLVLTCYDPASAPAVLEAVRDSGMNLNPQIDGNTVSAYEVLWRSLA